VLISKTIEERSKKRGKKKNTLNKNKDFAIVA
jgi:hypothetical protein